MQQRLGFRVVAEAPLHAHRHVVRLQRVGERIARRAELAADRRQEDPRDHVPPDCSVSDPATPRRPVHERSAAQSNGEALARTAAAPDLQANWIGTFHAAGLTIDTPPHTEARTVHGQSNPNAFTLALRMRCRAGQDLMHRERGPGGRSERHGPRRSVARPLRAPVVRPGSSGVRQHPMHRERSRLPRSDGERARRLPALASAVGGTASKRLRG